MTAQETGIGDIFEGAEKIEIFGKLPSLLWAYISRAHAVIEQCKAGGDVSARSAQELRRLLGVLDSAAHHLDNKDLKQLISKQAQVLAGFGSGNLSGPQFAESLGAGLPLLKQVAG
ncbi:MAG: hypothetical protein FJY85_08550, partial [Deltaproteobacteria bacterium]|nr:hypothetical protein [Deltaproteobacteria bacterium]